MENHWESEMLRNVYGHWGTKVRVKEWGAEQSWVKWSGMTFGGICRLLFQGLSPQDHSSNTLTSSTNSLPLITPHPSHFVLFQLNARPCHIQPRSCITLFQLVNFKGRHRGLHPQIFLFSNIPSHPGLWLGLLHKGFACLSFLPLPLLGAPA